MSTLNYKNPLTGEWELIAVGGIEDAPNDGKSYVRNSQEWSEITAESLGALTEHLDISNKADKNSVYTKSETETLVNDVNQIATEANTIAKGASVSMVFDTTEDMLNWAKDEANKGKLKIGDHFYIKELEVPDYWVSNALDTPNEDGYYYEYSLLETLKADLSNVVKKDDTIATDCLYIHAQDANGNSIRILKSDMASLISELIKNNPNLLANVNFGLKTITDLQNTVGNNLYGATTVDALASVVAEKNGFGYPYKGIFEQNIDINNITETGHYALYNAENQPLYGWARLLVTNLSSPYVNTIVRQEIFSVFGHNIMVRMWTYADSWSEWQKII